MVTDPWKMFRGADFGDNIEEVVETEECKVLEAAGFASVVCHTEKEKHWLCILAKK